jgi:nuclease HARBI1
MNKQQLLSLIRCSRIPNSLTSTNGQRFTADELLLCGLYRLHFPNRVFDIGWVKIFGFDAPTVSRCFNLFSQFMVHHWSYLLFDHLNYWLKHLCDCTMAIHQKLLDLGCPFPYPSEVGGLRIFGFIDNTILGTDRPGGGPVEDGEGSLRKDPIIQRAFYNGWKKVHGVKFQTVDLPNGMNAQISGPYSCRRNDLFTLRDSNLNQKLSDLQRNEIVQYKVYGDSAYIVLSESHIRARHHNVNNTEREILENKVMSSCRQSIEWNYNDLKQSWKFLNTKHCLKLMRMNISSYIITAMIIRNAHVTLNGNITSSYFNCRPPTLEDWTSEGPR